MTYRGSWVLVLLLLHLAGLGFHAVAAQSTRCGPKFSFFPKGGEDRNVPHAWGKTAQMAAGNYRDDTLYNIVLTSTNNLPGIVAEAVPMLHVAPIHPLLVVGSNSLPASCTGFVPQPAMPDAIADKGAAAIGGAPDAAAGTVGAPVTAAGAVGAADPAAGAVDIAESAQIAGPGDAAAAAAAAPDAAAGAISTTGPAAGAVDIAESAQTVGPGDAAAGAAGAPDAASGAVNAASSAAGAVDVAESAQIAGPGNATAAAAAAAEAAAKEAEAAAEAAAKAAEAGAPDAAAGAVNASSPAAGAVDIAESAQIAESGNAAAAAAAAAEAAAKEAEAAAEAAAKAAEAAAAEPAAAPAVPAAAESEESPIEPDAAAIAAHQAALAAKEAVETLKKASAAASNSTAGSSSDAEAIPEKPVRSNSNSTAAATRQLLSSSSSSSSSSTDWITAMDWQDESLSDNNDAMLSHSGRHLLGGEVVTHPASYRLQYSLNGSEPVDTGDVNMLTPVQRITLSGLKGYPDGYYCLMLKLTIVAGSGRMGGYIPVPPFDLHSMSQVCFYKLDGVPSGKVSFSSCSENLGVTFKDLKPQPIPLHPGSPQSLFNSVFYFNAFLNRTKDWSWPSDATPKRMDHWVVLDQKSAGGRPQLWIPEEKLADGWYNLRMEGSVTSDFPSLLALNSMRAGKYEGINTPPELAEKPKYLATAQYNNGTVAGVQYVQTEFKQLTGPEEDMRLSVGDEMVLNWDFDGFGDMYCYSDGKVYNNMGDFQCRSPAQIRIPDRYNHTFRVALQDVCNNTFVVDAVYGTWGYKVVRAPLPRAKTEEPFISSNGYTSGGEKFELGAPANAVLRNPKAVTAKATQNAGTQLRPMSTFAMGFWAAGLLWAAVVL